MAQVIKEIELEVSKPNFIQAIVAKQYDNKSRYLRVKLVDNGEKITVADTSTVTINAKRSDGDENKFAGRVDAGQGTVLVPLTYWMLELEGRVISDVSVYNSDEILTTTNFTIEVERASCQDGSVSVDDADVDVLTSLIIEVQNVKTNYDVKHTYDPTSTNALSGKAVNTAIILANAKAKEYDNAVKREIREDISDLQETFENKINSVSKKDSNLASFIQNTDIDYAFDSITNANYTIVRIYKNRIDGVKQYPFVYAPNGVNRGTMSTYDLAHTEGWLFAINAGVFDTSDGTPDGIVIQNGTVVQNEETIVHSKCKPLTIDSDGNLGYADYDANATNLIGNGIISAVAGFMPIIVNYEPVDSSEWNDISHYTENAQRQIIGQFGNGDYAIITCEGRNHNNSDGWTIAEAQTICQKHGLKFAYNLDGGGSTETMLGLKHINTIYEGSTGRKVPTFIVFNGTSAFGKPSDIIVPDTPDTPEVEEPEIVIPSGYVEVDYIQTDGTQYIKTSIPETELYSIEYKAVNEYFEDTHGHILSSANTYYSFVKKFAASTNQTVVSKWKGNEQSAAIALADVSTPYVVKSVYNGNNVTVYVNNQLMTTSTVGTTSSPANTYCFFTYGGTPDAEKYRFTGKLYYMSLRNTSNTLVHHFVPVYREFDATFGLYDVVDGVFYQSNTDTPLNGGLE